MIGWEKAKFFVIRHHTGLMVWGLALFLALTPLVMANPYNLGILNLIGLYVIVVLGLNLFIGFAGQISLGHAAFFGLGAYGSAILTATYGFPAWPAMILTAGAVALAALVLGVPTLRLSGHYLAMATLGFNYVVDSIFVQWDAVTGGPSGLSGVPPLSIGGLTFDSDLKFHYLVWTFALVALTLCLNLVRSGVGRGLAALAADEVAAAALGVDVRRPKKRRLRALRGHGLGGRQPLRPLLRLRQPRRLQRLQVPGSGDHGGGGRAGLRLGHPVRGLVHHHLAPFPGVPGNLHGHHPRGDPGGDPPLPAPGVRVRTGGYHPHPLGPAAAGHGPAIVKPRLMRLIR